MYKNGGAVRVIRNGAIGAIIALETIGITTKYNNPNSPLCAKEGVKRLVRLTGGLIKKFFVSNKAVVLENQIK